MIQNRKLMLHQAVMLDPLDQLDQGVREKKYFPVRKVMGNQAKYLHQDQKAMVQWHQAVARKLLLKFCKFIC